LNVREARPEDARAIAEVHLASWKTTYPGIIPQDYIDGLRVENGMAQWKARLKSRSSTVLVAEDEAGIFGFAAGGTPVHPVDGYDAELGAIYLLATHQRQGAGQELVRRLAQELRAQGFASLLVWALRENGACDFYEALGGTLVAEKSIEIGGKLLPEVAFGWRELATLCQVAR
jgi:L-amino acid N-acyltransferase YncA